MNAFKTFLLMFGLTLLLVWLGQAIGGRQGMIYALFFAGIMNFGSYWFSDKIVLMMYGAREIKENELSGYHTMVAGLVQAANLPMPKLYYIQSPMPNAFATGRNPAHAAVAVTQGILDLLDERELRGVIAHELAHVKNRDVLISTVAATVAGAIFTLSRMAMFFGGGRDRDDNGGGIGALAIAIIAPIAAMIIQMAVSRSREYQADSSGAGIAGDPLALAGALRKLTAGVKQHPVAVNPTTAHLFIVSPFSGKSLFTLFSTHPPLDERIRRLETMAAAADPYKTPKIIY
jgi:heat shock protein HtpX